MLINREQFVLPGGSEKYGCRLLQAYSRTVRRVCSFSVLAGKSAPNYLATTLQENLSNRLAVWQELHLALDSALFRVYIHW